VKPQHGLKPLGPIHLVPYACCSTVLRIHLWQYFSAFAADMTKSFCQPSGSPDEACPLQQYLPRPTRPTLGSLPTNLDNATVAPALHLPPSGEASTLTLNLMLLRISKVACRLILASICFQPSNSNLCHQCCQPTTMRVCFPIDHWTVRLRPQPLTAATFPPPNRLMWPTPHCFTATIHAI